MRRVSLISVTPVKCFALNHPDSIELTGRGVPENRRFVLVDRENKRLRSSLTSWPMVIRGEYDPAGERLWMRFPDGAEVEGGAVGSGDPIEVDFHEKVVASRVVEGEWNERFSRLAGHPVRLMRPEEHGHVQNAAVTLVSEASLDRLAQEAERSVDGRRFRMLFTLAGCGAHEEDEWEGRLLRIGEVVVRAGGPVDRCAMTTRDPDTGERDLDTLRLIKGYRGVTDGNTVDFGVYATIVEPGRVRVGDSLEPT